ncbi:hypothetical protein [Paenibacillus sp. GCM10028914]|uniref:hypothetical protein n=1 Tax=Paenibacillus sp. GCM10028914 TaxID=3273416 RepID=UPI003615EF5E
MRGKSGSSSGLGRSMPTGKRRYAKKSGRRKHHNSHGRYKNRQGASRKRFIPPESSPTFHQGHEQAYNEEFKVGFAQGYEDGRFSALSSQ